MDEYVKLYKVDANFPVFLFDFVSQVAHKSLWCKCREQRKVERSIFSRVNLLMHSFTLKIRPGLVNSVLE